MKSLLCLDSLISNATEPPQLRNWNKLLWKSIFVPISLEIQIKIVKSATMLMVWIMISSLKMTMWADNVKFVKDILDSKYQKIDSAVLEVIFSPDKYTSKMDERAHRLNM